MHERHRIRIRIIRNINFSVELVCVTIVNNSLDLISSFVIIAVVNAIVWLHVGIGNICLYILVVGPCACKDFIVNTINLASFRQSVCLSPTVDLTIRRCIISLNHL